MQARARRCIHERIEAELLALMTGITIEPLKCS